VKILRWFVLGITLFFLVKTFRQHWQDVVAIELDVSQLYYSAIALILTLTAHIWSAIVWAGILKFLQQPSSLIWVLPIYLQTNLAKYIPGNVWHFYGRIRAMQSAGVHLGTATLTTLLEPLLMATAAVLIAMMTLFRGGLITAHNQFYDLFPFFFAGTILMVIHPRFLNPLLALAGRFKHQSFATSYPQIQQYPWRPLCGEIGFVILRASGFMVTIASLTPLRIEHFPLLLGVFSLSWFFGLVVPSPGGIGVFESIAIALLNSTFSPAILLSSLALFRLLSITAEALAGVLAWGVAQTQMRGSGGEHREKMIEKKNEIRSAIKNN